jgi:outer membrane biosynthesis protein TonB
MNIKFALIFLFLIIANPIKAESININEGAVTFILSINENGEVIDANIKNTEPDNVFDEDFLAEIKEIVMEMKFTPKIVNDKAVRFKGTKTFKFINGDKLKK